MEVNMDSIINGSGRSEFFPFFINNLLLDSESSVSDLFLWKAAYQDSNSRGKHHKRKEKLRAKTITTNGDSLVDMDGWCCGSKKGALVLVYSINVFATGWVGGDFTL